MSEHSLSAYGQTYDKWVGGFRIEQAEPHNGQPGGSTYKIKHSDNYYVEPPLDWSNTKAVVDYWRAHTTDQIVCFSKVCLAAARGKLPPVNDNSNPTETDAEAAMATIADAANIFDNALARGNRSDNGSAPTIPFDPNRDALGIGQPGPVTTQSVPNALGIGVVIGAVIWILRRLI